MDVIFYIHKGDSLFFCSVCIHDPPISTLKLKRKDITFVSGHIDNPQTIWSKVHSAVGVSTSALGLVFTAGLLADLILLRPIGWLSDRLEARIVLTPALLLMSGTLAYFPQATSLPVLILGSIVRHPSEKLACYEAHILPLASAAAHWTAAPGERSAA